MTNPDLHITAVDMFPNPIRAPCRASVAGVVESVEGVGAILNGDDKLHCFLMDSEGLCIKCCAVGANALPE
eukprot:8665169-Karenia_brevis.AAC.1